VTNASHNVEFLRFEDLDQLDYRRWADDCAKQAHNPRISGDEREYLLTRQRALLVLAAHEEWQHGGQIVRKGH
jgi:hypothetical protein